ncbi:hypothetical protein quinque_007204 [Culex quinquefasciatus]
MVNSTSTPGSMLIEVICYDLGRRVQIDDTLVLAHLEAIPSLGTLTARRLTGRDTQLLHLGAADQVSAHLIQAADIARGQRDANPVNRRDLGNGLLDVLSSGVAAS